jgi:predicted PurR-regulated permease PerM
VPRGPVPQQLRIGLVLTWVTSAVVVLGLSLTIAAIALDPALVDESIERAIAENPAMAGEVTIDQVRVGLYAVLAAFVGWAIAAACLAAFAWSGRSWAWVTLCVSAGLAAGLLFLVTVLGGILAVIPLAATAGSLALMLRPEVRAWYAAR